MPNSLSSMDKEQSPKPYCNELWLSAVYAFRSDTVQLLWFRAAYAFRSDTVQICVGRAQFMRFG